ncbi:hypothetical protein BDD12DRAFT_346233 [Trichophaea hybrida]|nr:hypothetical protein BDD12DRAFT_346233 [Trichophaea hybrida]
MSILSQPPPSAKTKLKARFLAAFVMRQSTRSAAIGSATTAAVISESNTLDPNSHNSALAIERASRNISDIIERLEGDESYDGNEIELDNALFKLERYSNSIFCVGDHSLADISEADWGVVQLAAKLTRQVYLAGDFSMDGAYRLISQAEISTRNIDERAC